MKRLIGAAFFVIISSLPSFAASEGFVVASCPGSLGVNAYTAGQYGAITVDVNGIQCTSGSGGGGGGTSSTFGSSFPTTGTAAGFTDGTNMVAAKVRTPGSTATASDPAIVTIDPGVLSALNTGNGSLATIAANTGASIPAGTNAIGSITNTSFGVSGPVTAVGPTAVGSANANPPIVVGGTATGAAGQNVQGLSIVAPSVAPVTATNTAVVVDLRPDSPGIITLGPTTTALSVSTVQNSQYPTNSVTTTPTAVTATATGTTAATAATLAATASVTNYVCGFNISAAATSLTTGTATLSGTISGSLAYIQTVQAVASGATILTQTFNPCIPASAANTAITITSAAAGTLGNTIVNIWGYRL